MTLKERQKSDLSFSKHTLKKDFKGFMAHAVKLAEAFQLVDAGWPTRNDHKRHKDHNRSGNPPGKSSTAGPTQEKKSANSGRPKKEVAICLWLPHKAQNLRHRFKDCSDCPDDEKKCF